MSDSQGTRISLPISPISSPITLTCPVFLISEPHWKNMVNWKTYLLAMSLKGLYMHFTFSRVASFSLPWGPGSKAVWRLGSRVSLKERATVRKGAGRKWQHCVNITEYTYADTRLHQAQGEMTQSRVTWHRRCKNAASVTQHTVLQQVFFIWK